MISKYLYIYLFSDNVSLFYRVFFLITMTLYWGLLEQSGGNLHQRATGV